MSPFRASVFTVGVLLSLVTPRAHGQPPSNIDPKTIAAFERLGARFHRAWHGPWAEYEDRERGPRGVPMVRFSDRVPSPKLFPLVTTPFGLDLSHSGVNDALLKELADVDNLVALNLRYTDDVTAAGIKEMVRSRSLRWLALSGPHVKLAELSAAATLSNISELDLRAAELRDAKLKEIAGMKNLTALNLDVNDSLTDKGLVHLAGLENLKTLSLDYAQVTDAGLKNLVGLKSLTSLDLFNTRVTDQGVKELTKIKNLTKLRLGSVHAAARITDKGLKDLGQLTSLTELELIGTRITDAGLKELAGLENLTHLSLKQNKITNAGLKNLTGLKDLTALNLFKTGVTDVGLRDLAGLKNLVHIEIHWTKVTDQTLLALRDAGLLHALYSAKGKEGTRARSADEVVSLDLHETPVTDAGLKAIVDLRNLEELTAYLTKISDAGLKDIAGFKNLKRLSLSGSKVSDANLKELAGLKNLNWLYISDEQVTDRSMRTLREVGLLHTLWQAWGAGGARAKSPRDVVRFHFSSAKVTDACLKELADFTNLEELDLSYMKLKDGLKDVAHLKKLTTLRLHRTSFEGSSFKDLLAMQQLESLYLDSLSLETAKQLSVLKKLKMVSFVRRGSSNAELQEIQKVLPGVQIAAYYPC